MAEVYALNVKNIQTGEVYFSRAAIVDVSPTGCLLKVERGDILSPSLRSTLTLSSIHDVGVGFTIEIMDTYLEGVMTRTKPEGKGSFVAAVDFRDDAPEYWRNALFDILPESRDFDDPDDDSGEGSGLK